MLFRSHENAHHSFRRQNLFFMIPVIIMSTVTGTANFSQGNIPDEWQATFPLIIGGVNLIAAIITTIYQFLRINELMESHRVSSVSFSKLGRTISVELNLPRKSRTDSGDNFLRLCRNEFDRLIEQSPSIPKEILHEFDKKFKSGTFIKPEILDIRPVNVFVDPEEKLANSLIKATDKFFVEILYTLNIQQKFL